MIVSQMLSMVDEGYANKQVICDDTDVFVLLLHHVKLDNPQKRQPPVGILMQSTSTTEAISILNTLSSLPSHLVSSLLAAHCLSGCYTVPQMFGIGKKKVIKLLKSQVMFAINNMGCTDTSISWEALEEECIRFICALYGQNNGASLAEIRYTKWIGKCKANTMISVLRLNCLPPTEEAVKLNIKRAHYQCSIWRNVKMVHPTVLLNE